MKLILHKLHIAILFTEYKLATLTGNLKVQQNAIEKIVLLHTQMRVEKDQEANRLLFTNH